MKQQARVTIKEIARRAGTSTATVSRVLRNDGYPISEELKERVLAVARELNYSPNLIGRYLKNHSSSDVGVIIPTITNPFYSLLILGIEEVLNQNNYSMLLCNSFRDEEKEKRYIDLLFQKQVKGLIVASIARQHDYLQQYIDRGLQVVTFDQEVEDLDCTKVLIDYEKGSYLAMQHLFANGHRAIGFLSAPLTRKSRKLIYEGYLKAMREQGIKINKEWVVIADTEVERNGEVYEFENGKKIAAKLLTAYEKPTAVLVINDMTAYGVMHELASRGVKVPEDLSLVSFDNIFFSQITNPPLTTVSYTTYEMGKLAAEYLIKKLTGSQTLQANIILEPVLVERSSVKPVG
ncbi:Ribose operon repressor [Neomoorella glycerini]|uniref:Ribose operon repressor n=1 Tax=Neomoorella glycerini TaxID=55779 RepID=A0A6I5ZPZ1_9FIRM|nr:LacI family DNA-binding transcriptional regulator [Moorella glycerini]QGP92042.1 Ribose operon repressor [Moorella glycerini]